MNARMRVIKCVLVVARERSRDDLELEQERPKDPDVKDRRTHHCRKANHCCQKPATGWKATLCFCNVFATLEHPPRR